MGLLGRAVRDLVEPLQDPLLEQVGGIGVVVRARRIDEHVSPTRVPVHVSVLSVREERRQLGRGNPIVRIGKVNAEPHIVPPFAAQFMRRLRPTHQHARSDAAPLLGKELGGKRAQRESHDGVCSGVVQCRATRDVFDGVVADAASVRHAIIQSREDPSGIHVGGVHRMARRAQAVGEGAQPLSEALCVMEQQDLGHVSSVRLYATSC